MPNIRIDPKINPLVEIQIDESSILLGINSKKEIANITPPANASILYINLFDGFFRTPIKEPITGPKTEIATIINK